MDLPAFAAWRHHDSRTGFEVAFPRATRGGLRLAGHTTAIEDGHAWAVEYEIDVDPQWCTTAAWIAGRSAAARREIRLEIDRDGGWSVDGRPAPHLHGCLDVDLESSSLTNAFPIHRLGLGVGEGAEAPAAWVRALDLSVERLEQRYLRIEDEGSHTRYDYSAPQFESGASSFTTNTG